jgi:N-terminal domain of anti-restriction factor ArdC
MPRRSPNASPDLAESAGRALASVARTRAWVVGIGSAPGGAHTERSPAVPGTRKHQLTDEERDERRRADREYARQAVEQLRSSEGWQRWLRTRRHFHAYSFGNQLLIAMAPPTATRVAGFRAWLKLGYVVRRGERAIKVWAPCPPSRKQLERWRQDGGDPDQRPRTYFRLVPVFDTLSRVRVACQSKNSVGPRDTGIGVKSNRRVTWLNRGKDDAAGLRGRRGAGGRRSTA